MRARLLVLCLFFFAVVLPSQANPINYVINFTTNPGGLAPTSGFFTYDSTTAMFSNFLVSWHGATFDLTASANAPNASQNTLCAGEAATPQYGFLLMSQSTSCPLAFSFSWITNVSNGFFGGFGFTVQTSGLADFISSNISTCPGCVDTVAKGTWTIAPAPEPPSGLLAATGLLCLLVARRKLGTA
jgi:hypothetical protein